MKKIFSIFLCLCFMICLSVPALAIGYKGDVNKDGKVNSADALMVLQYAVGTREDISLVRADINGDGRVNSVDALQILQTSVGEKELIKFCDCAE